MIPQFLIKTLILLSVSCVMRAANEPVRATQELALALPHGFDVLPLIRAQKHTAGTAIAMTLDEPEMHRAGIEIGCGMSEA